MGVEPAVEVVEISKHFGKRDKGIQALDHVSFSVPKETVFCILGPNGAGKTTLLKILTTVTRPDTGTARMEGHDIHTDVLAVRNLIGVVAQENRFDHYLSIWDNLVIHAQMHGLPRSVYEARITELLKKMELYSRRTALPDTLSGGMQRRVALIRALIHHPKLLFLDEPTTGLDPQARREIWEMIREFKKTATVLLTTHYMEEADILSDWILMLNHGRVVMSGTARELTQSLVSGNVYDLVLIPPKAHVYESLLRLRGIEPISVLDDYRLRFQLANPEALQLVLGVVDPKDVQQLGHMEIDLEAVFLKVAGEQNPKPEGIVS